MNHRRTLVQFVEVSRFVVQRSGISIGIHMRKRMFGCVQGSGACWGRVDDGVGLR